MKTDKATRDQSGAMRGSGVSSERMRNAEPRPDTSRSSGDRAGEVSSSRPASEDLILHDDDEAELDLPR
jgi:hypothetical protein